MSTGHRPQSSEHCAFLALPIELRLQIYDYVLPGAVTFSTALLAGSYSDVVHRLYGDGRQPFYGIPKDHIPVVAPQYDESLLSLTKTPVVDATSHIRREELGICSYTSRSTMLLVSRQVHDEIMESLLPERSRELSRLSLFIAFPHGLRIFDAIGTHLLAGARSIQIAGMYTNSSFSAVRAAKCDADAEDSTAVDSAKHLETLILYVLGEVHRVKQLQLRIFYPGQDSYSTVWGDDASPTVVALRSIWASDIDIEVWRSQEGTGVYFTARPNNDGKRNVSTYWRKLSEDHGKQWVIHPAWPDVTDEDHARYAERSVQDLYRTPG